MREILFTVCRYGIFGVLLLSGVMAPWFFGAWEMWWFWPFVTAQGIGLVLLGAQWIIGGKTGDGQSPGARPIAPLFLWTVPFLAYAITRGVSESVVWMDAERAILLHLTGIIVAAMAIFGLQRRDRHRLVRAVWAGLAVMAVYGIVNHLVFGSVRVLWMPRYEQYAGRATGPYYCPDHFAGAMELLFCISAGIVLDRETRRRRDRIAAAIAAILAAVGVLLSQSRGGGMTLVVITGAVTVWGFSQWPPWRIRLAWRTVVISGGLLLLIAGVYAAPGYRERFLSYADLRSIPSEDHMPAWENAWQRLRRTSRGRMYGGAWRAWKSAPWTGIGPGMHQHLWPRFAATDDGDREQARWPEMTNTEFHSYEVHSDWLQLLEEYGVIGFLLFLAPCLILAWRLRAHLARDADRWRCADPDRPEGDAGYAFVLGALLAGCTMGFHSLGDFNLQMPGTVWMLAIILTAGLAETGETVTLARGSGSR